MAGHDLSALSAGSDERIRDGAEIPGDICGTQDGSEPGAASDQAPRFAAAVTFWGVIAVCYGSAGVGNRAAINALEFVDHGGLP